MDSGLNIEFDAPKPIFAKREPDSGFPNKRHKSSSSAPQCLESVQSNVVELKPVGLDGLHKRCHCDDAEFDSSRDGFEGVPWPIKYYPGTVELDRSQVHRVFCSFLCARTFLKSRRETTENDLVRLNEYAELKYGFKMLPGPGLPRWVLFRQTNYDHQQQQPHPQPVAVTVEEFRSYGDYGILIGKPELSRIDEVWLKSPTVSSLSLLQELSFEAVRRSCRWLASDTEPVPRCYHDNQSWTPSELLDLPSGAWRPSFPLGSSRPRFKFCSLRCFVSWAYTADATTVNRTLVVAALRRETLRTLGSLELPTPAPDKVFYDAYSLKGVRHHSHHSSHSSSRTQSVRQSLDEPISIEQVQQFHMSGDFVCVLQQPGLRFAGMNTKSKQGHHHHPSDGPPSLTASLSPDEAFRLVSATFKTRGQEYFDYTQNSPELERSKASGPLQPQTYRVNGVNLRTHTLVPKKK